MWSGEGVGTPWRVFGAIGGVLGIEGWSDESWVILGIFSPVPVPLEVAPPVTALSSVAVFSDLVSFLDGEPRIHGGKCFFRTH